MHGGFSFDYVCSVYTTFYWYYGSIAAINESVVLHELHSTNSCIILMTNATDCFSALQGLMDACLLSKSRDQNGWSDIFIENVKQARTFHPKFCYTNFVSQCSFSDVAV